MAQWITVKGLAKKYQIDEDVILEWVEDELVVFSRFEKVLLIDEEGVTAYLEAKKKLEDKSDILDVLLQVDQMLERELQGNYEALAIMKLEGQMFPAYQLIIKALSKLVSDDMERRIFISLTTGGSLNNIAQQYSMTKEQVLVIMRNVVRKLNVAADDILRAEMEHCQYYNMMNHALSKANIELNHLNKQTKVEAGKMQKEIKLLANKRERLEAKIALDRKNLAEKNHIIRQLRKKLAQKMIVFEEAAAIPVQEETGIGFLASLKRKVKRFFR